MNFISDSVMRCTLVDTDLNMRWCLDVEVLTRKISEHKMETDFVDDHKSIFRYGAKYEAYFASLTNFLNKCEGHVVKFP